MTPTTSILVMVDIGLAANDACNLYQSVWHNFLLALEVHFTILYSVLLLLAENMILSQYLE